MHPIDAFGPACSYLALILLGLTVLGYRARSIRRRIRRRSLAHFTILPASRHSHVRTFRSW